MGPFKAAGVCGAGVLVSVVSLLVLMAAGVLGAIVLEDIARAGVMGTISSASGTFWSDAGACAASDDFGVGLTRPAAEYILRHSAVIVDKAYL